MGRKKEFVTRSEYISFRVSALEKKAIELSANEVNLSTSDFARRASMNMKVTVRFSEEELKVYSSLHKFHANFSRISNLIKCSEVSGKSTLLSEIWEVKQLIKLHLKQFQK